MDRRRLAGALPIEAMPLELINPAELAPPRTYTHVVIATGSKLVSLPAIEQGRASLFGDHRPADTIVGVTALARPDYLIEVEAIAVI